MTTRNRLSVVFVLLCSAWLFATPVAAQIGSLVVSITSPASGATVSSTIPVNADVTIVGMLTVAGVQFKLDGVNLGPEDTSSPYSVQWNTKTASNAAHTLTAVARDGFGVLWTSSAVTVTVFNDLTPPTVSITSPAIGATVRGAINIAGAASDNVGVVGVQFKIDGANFGAEDTTAPYGIAWDTNASANGSHAVTAVARDAAGNTTTSASVTVTVDNSAPSVSIASPAAGSFVAGAVTVNANASDNLAVVGVQFRLDGAALGAEDVTAPFATTWNTATASNGSHALTAVARDAAGNVTTSAAITLTVDNSAPAVNITSPAAASTVSGAITVTADATDNIAVAGVQFLLDGVALGAEDVTAPFDTPWDTVTASNGSHTLTAVARDAAGNVTTSAAISISVLNDSTGPSVSIASPANGATVSLTVAVTAAASDNVAIAGVQFRLDGAALGAEDTAAPYSVDWNTSTATNGAHILTAIARDTSGNLTTSASVTVSVLNDATSPTVQIDSPLNGANVSATVSIMASASDDVGVIGVQFFVDGVALGTEDLTAPYDVNWDTSAASSGAHALTAVARDAAGHSTTSAAVSVTVGSQSSTVTRFEDTHADIFYTPSSSWMLGFTGAYSWSGGSTALGFVAASRATLSFSGTGVSWIGFRGPQAGIANVYLDSVLVATIDGYSATATAQVALYTASDLTNGTHTIAIEATHTKNDASSDFFVAVDAFDITTQGPPPETTPPSVTLTSPSEGATLSGTVTLAATASDNVGVTFVRFYVDGNPFGADDTTAPYEMSWSTLAASNGSHTVMAQARDAAGNTGLSMIVHVTVSNTDTTPPTVTITAPAGASTVFGTVTVTANASDNGTVAGVQFFLDGAVLGAEDTSAPYSAAWNTTTAANGSHTLTAQARDGAGNTTVSSAVTVTVANGPGSNIRIEDGNTAITYDLGWNVGNTSRPWSGGTAAVGFGTGQDAFVTFRGTGITWIGFRGGWAGIANVYVDGVFAATIDLYAATESVQAPVFSVSGLALGTHTVRVEVTRTKNAASADFVVIVDAFDIIDAPPDTVAPSVSITTPANGATLFGTTPVRANADDDNGVASVTFFVDDVQVDAVDTMSPYAINWNTTTVADGPHTLTAVARDAAGNVTTSAPVAVTVANAAPPALATATRIENTSLGIVYVDGCSTCGGAAASWYHGSRSRTWSDGTASVNRADGGRATYTFMGTAVKWIGFRAAWAGIARVFVDGAFHSEIDLFSPTEEVEVPVFQVADLSPGTHTIAIEATGRKNAEAQDNAVFLDAFDVSPATPPPTTGTRSEESAPSATFTAGWNKTDTSQAWSGTTAAVASGVAERATFVFTGTSVNWIGKRGTDMGIARVYLDGAFQAQVDSYYPTLIQGLVYSVTGLMPGQHRLEIEVTGLKNGQSTGAAIAVDAFDVSSRIEDSDAPVVYTGTWAFYDTTRNYSGTSLTTGVGTAAIASTAGARADVTFSGTSVTWVGTRGPMGGIADVYVDGALTQQIDLYAATETVQAPIFSASGLAAGTHTLRVEATGTKNPASSTTRVNVDTFDVTLPSPAPQITRVQETDSAIAYTAGWNGAGTAALFSGTAAKESRTVGAQATFTFTGTSVRWISERGFTTGVARVSIDGQFIGVVDTRTPFQEEYQDPLFIANNLAAGTHTLTIEIVGRNNEAPGTLVERVVIDAFDVRQ